MRTKVLGYVVLVLLTFGLLELLLALFTHILGPHYLAYLTRFIYYPPHITQSDFDHYMSIRDPQLGWPAPGGRNMDSSGARPSPAFPTPGNECVSLYGDSFTHGNDKISDADTWGNKLAVLLGCRVANFGVPAHGTDQSLLRFTRNSDDQAPISILGIYADNVQRNVNQERYFLVGGDVFGLKPRFVIDQAGLKLIPIAKPDIQEMRNTLENPVGAALWSHDSFRPGSVHGSMVWSFPYIASLVRLAVSQRLWDYILDRPDWIDFYEPGHDSQALQTTVAIVDKFAQVARYRNKRAFVLLFSAGSGNRLWGGGGVQYFQRTGVSPLENLAKPLRKAGISVHDLTEYFGKYLSSRSYCELLDQRPCRGRLNAEANAVVAKAVYELVATPPKDRSTK